ncbi:unnamed protein product [Rotaria magnacalcarata]
MGLFAQKHADFLKAGERLVINLIDSVEPGNKDFNLFRKSRQKNLQQNQKDCHGLAIKITSFLSLYDSSLQVLVFFRLNFLLSLLLNKI